MEDYIKRSWAEVDLTQIKLNYQIYKEGNFANQQVMAVVKANAYGHGDVEISKVLSDLGVKNFAVSNVDEACKLRDSGIKGDILILGYTPIEQIQRLYDNDITQAIISEEYAEMIAKTSVKVKCQFAIDTGMNRVGIDADFPDWCGAVIRKYNGILNLKGVFTHLCVADQNQDGDIAFTKQQLHKFKDVTKKIKDLNLPYVHCLNSAGGLWYNSSESVFVRLGIILYGLKPDYSNILPVGIRPALSWKSVVAMTRFVRVGETIGYGRTYMAEQDIKIAVIPTGYADGYNRLLSNKGFVLINGKKAPVVGKVCMDQFMVDVTKINDVQIGTEVILLGESGDESLTADEMAEMVGTIGYEIVCNISDRVPRVYI